MKKYLVKFSSDWADEFTAEGFAIMDQEDCDKFKEEIKKPHTFYFGTNEGWEDEIFENDITIIEITPEEETVLIKLFPDLEKKVSNTTYEGKDYTFVFGGDYGQFPSLFHLLEDEESEDEEEEGE